MINNITAFIVYLKKFTNAQTSKLKLREFIC